MMELPELTGINDHAINLVENKPTLSGPGNKLGEAGNFEDLYQDLANGFTQPSKSQVENPILFLFRKDGSL